MLGKKFFWTPIAMINSSAPRTASAANVKDLLHWKRLCCVLSFSAGYYNYQARPTFFRKCKIPGLPLLPRNCIVHKIFRQSFAWASDFLFSRFLIWKKEIRKLVQKIIKFCPLRARRINLFFYDLSNNGGFEGCHSVVFSERVFSPFSKVQSNGFWHW